jgi:hypothetical protein
MAWFKADDRIMEHGKFISARAKGGHAVIGVWFHAGTWANGQMTDGFIPRSWATLNSAEVEAALLVEVGLWDEDASRDGWQMHDYADYQPLKVELEAKSQQKRSSGQAGGKQTASRRAAKVKPVPVPEPVTRPKGLVRAHTSQISSKQERNIKRLGLEPTGGNAA